MSRQPHRIQHSVITLLTICTLDRERLFDDPSIAREAIETLYRVRALHPFFLYGFVVMPDHCHLLLYVPSPLTVSRIINIYKTACYTAFGIAPLWQKRFHIRIVRRPYPVLRYIHDNPVVAVMVQRAEDYPWSSAGGLWEIDSL